MKKVLLIYPEFPNTFWSFRYALKFVGKRSTFPPLGLLTVAALLPSEWQVKLVDLNVEELTRQDIEWADLIMISAMAVQRASVEKLLREFSSAGKRTVAGGPLFTMHYDEFQGKVDHIIVGEAEVVLPRFLKDLEEGKAESIYFPEGLADITRSPVPRFELADLSKYSSMNVQFSRGCPFSCEFCDIPILYGHRPRTKEASQVIAELEKLYELGWRGGVFFVDDNFIGNRRKLKKEILPALIEWSKSHDYPFRFFTEASLNLAGDEELMDMMVEAGFDEVFVGIESPNPESLKEAHKLQNIKLDLSEAIRKIHSHGLVVQGGFIIGFDSDPPGIFDALVDFIQKNGIITAMVGLLKAPRGTRLYEKLKAQGRLLKEFVADNTDFSINFIPKMDYSTLVQGYRRVVTSLYSAKNLYKRLSSFLDQYRPVTKARMKLTFNRLMAFFKSIFVLGLKDRGRLYYWKSLVKTLIKKPKLLPLTVTFQIYAYHFRKIYQEQSSAIPLLLSRLQQQTHG